MYSSIKKYSHPQGLNFQLQTSARLIEFGHQRSAVWGKSAAVVFIVAVILTCMTDVNCLCSSEAARHCHDFYLGNAAPSIFFQNRIFFQKVWLLRASINHLTAALHTGAPHFTLIFSPPIILKMTRTACLHVYKLKPCGVPLNDLDHDKIVPNSWFIYLFILKNRMWKKMRAKKKKVK